MDIEGYIPTSKEHHHYAESQSPLQDNVPTILTTLVEEGTSQIQEEEEEEEDELADEYDDHPPVLNPTLFSNDKRKSSPAILGLPLGLKHENKLSVHLSQQRNSIEAAMLLANFNKMAPPHDNVVVKGGDPSWQDDLSIPKVKPPPRRRRHSFDVSLTWQKMPENFLKRSDLLPRKQESAPPTHPPPHGPPYPPPIYHPPPPPPPAYMLHPLAPPHQQKEPHPSAYYYTYPPPPMQQRYYYPVAHNKLPLPPPPPHPHYPPVYGQPMMARKRRRANNNPDEIDELEDEEEIVTNESEFPHMSLRDVEAARIDPEARPRKQKLRFMGDQYTPQWVRYNGQPKEGLCDTCKPGKWLQLKNSAYWYHKQFFHGISSVSGKEFVQPLETRWMDQDLVEGLCHQCQQWVAVSNVKRKNSVLWYRHAHKVILNRSDCMLLNDTL